MILFPVQSETFSDPAIKALLEALLQSLSSGDKDIAKTYGPIIVGFFTILFGLIGTFALLFVQWRQNQSLNKANARQFALMKSKEERDEIIKKLNSFYGPFKLLRTQSRILYDLFALDLRPPNGNFRTLRYLLEGKQFVGQNEEILIQILEIGKKVLKLIEAHSGVVDRPELQELLGKLGAHIRILQLAHEKKLTGPPQAFEDIVFPVAIDGAIESAILRLQDRLKQLMEFESERDGVSAKTEEPKDGTLEYYNSKVEEYANKTMFLDLSDFYRRFRAHLPRGGRILDAGRPGRPRTPPGSCSAGRRSSAGRAGPGPTTSPDRATAR